MDVLKYYFALVPVVTAPDSANCERKCIRIQIHNLANQNAVRGAVWLSIILRAHSSPWEVHSVVHSSVFFF